MDEAYFHDTIRPMIDGRHVELIGEISDAEKPDFLSGAIALLVPIDWPEPFGLVMIEAMACGTPVIAFNRGSVPEIIEHGVTGLIVEDEAKAVAAVRRLADLSRATMRRRFERRFTAERMAEGLSGAVSAVHAEGTSDAARRDMSGGGGVRHSAATTWVIAGLRRP